MTASEPQAAPSATKYQRLVYSVEDGALVVLVLAIDKREDMAAYRSALARLLAM